MADSISRFQPTQRFTSRVGDYAKYRPSYPTGLFDDLDRLVWNDRDETSPFHAEYNALLYRWCPDFAATNHKNIAPADIEQFFAPHAVTLLAHRNDQRFDLEGWKGRLRSASYCPVEGSEGWNALVEGIATLFVRCREADGLMTFPYVTKAYVGRLV